MICFDDHGEEVSHLPFSDHFVGHDQELIVGVGEFTFGEFFDFSNEARQSEIGDVLRHKLSPE